MRRLLRWILALITGLLMLMFIITLTTRSYQPNVPWKGKPALDTAAVNHLSEAIRFRTISYDDSSDGVIKMAQLRQLQAWMLGKYPNCTREAQPIAMPGGSMIYIFKGSDQTLKPAIFLAHMDVVPIQPGDTGLWAHDPFAGLVEHDTIYGRGSLDDKVMVVSMLEAMEKAIKQGQKRKRTIIFAFGHDEETGGLQGAKVIVAWLNHEHIQGEFVMDEGLGVTEGIVPGIKRPVAVIGIAEKGYLTLKLSITLNGGHSSMPKKENANTALIQALDRMDRYEFEDRFSEPMKQFFKQGAPEMGFGYKFLFSNLWITSPLVKMTMKKNEKTAASIHTTHAVTILRSGLKENAIPNYAEAKVNFRILPGETINDVVAKTKEILGDDRIKIEIGRDRQEPSNVSPSSGFAWDVIVNTTHEVFEDVVTLPGQVVAITDSKHYASISPNIYRFTPLRLNNRNISGIHGVNERIAVNNFMECVAFFGGLFAKL